MKGLTLEWRRAREEVMPLQFDGLELGSNILLDQVYNMGLILQDDATGDVGVALPHGGGYVTPRPADVDEEKGIFVGVFKEPAEVHRIEKARVSVPRVLHPAQEVLVAFGSFFSPGPRVELGVVGHLEGGVVDVGNQLVAVSFKKWRNRQEDGGFEVEAGGVE